ncbi:cyclic nucleotide-binding and patatin-like phospholipase domain-containing protein [Stigmatella erecta]|uniref:Predicted acylesterase/phospholipase RssA, contains patatin domain n=1 Tax=Stigmatella erecta TaxID=83460 RepID=A0A1H9YX17_9BACT|nr:cyclic nucleotide-binding and patatin-like phospholipase domain-containing protein [Stigmatella erecta]SES73793.1 Predicted acylesterase/phospholipase RssA, contains patatin domain [Stigmatella erecta]
MIELDGGPPPERGEPGLPSSRHTALNAWLLAHRYLMEEVFPVRRFPPGASIRRGGPGTGGPRALIVLSGEVAVTQVLLGSVDPYKSLYAGDVWVHPAGPGPAPEEGLFPVHLVAETACQLRVLAPERLAAFPELEELLGGYGEFQQKKHLFFEALRQTEPFRCIRARQLVDLLDRAEVRTYPRGERLCPGREGAEEGVYLVLRGELAELRRGRDSQERPAGRLVERPLWPGHLFGDLGRAPPDGSEREWVEVRSERAAVAFLAHPKAWRARREPEASGPLPELVLFRGDFSAAVHEWGVEPLRLLVDRVAEGIRTEYGDAILIVDVMPGLEVRMPRCPSPVDAQGRWVTHHRVHVPHGMAAAEGLSALARDAREWDYLFVRIAPSLWEGLTGPGGGGHGSAPVREGKLVWKLVQLDAGSDEVRLPPGFEPASTLFTVLLGPHPRRVCRADPVGTVRLRLEPRRLMHWERFEGLSSQERDSVLRWGRAITGRLVGVALGGGGAWGLAGLAVLQGMVERKIPIDLVSGTSFGALVAAFYCGRGPEGLELLLQQVPRLAWVVRASLISSEAIAWYVERMTGGIHLEELEVPCFPVATDISNAQVHIARWGSLGAGVRASGALAGVFSPAFAEGRRLVDGGFIANVPAAILKTWGASLIVAVNGVAKPSARQGAKPLFPTRVGWFLHGLNPIERAIDVMRSMILVFHTSGQQSAQMADVIFNSPFVNYSPWDYAHSQEILEQARTAARPVLETIQKKWDELRLTRRQREAVPAHPFQETPDADPNSAAG